MKCHLKQQWILLEIIVLSAVNQKKKGKHHMISLICRILHMTQMNISMKQNQGHRE